MSTNQIEESRATRAAHGAFGLGLVGGMVAIWASATDQSDRVFGLGVAAALRSAGSCSASPSDSG